MQFWVYFYSGVGGDGFINLLEHADNIMPIDNKLVWRIHRVVDGQVKFWQPTPDYDSCFRLHLVKSENYKLKQSYIDHVNNNNSIIIGSHDVHLLNEFKHSDSEILMKNKVRILLFKKDMAYANKISVIKNLHPSFKKYTSVPINQTLFDYVLDIDQIQSSWEYLDKFCKAVDIHLKPVYYNEYIKLINGDTNFVMYDGYEIYNSSIVNNTITYTKEIK